MADDPDPGVPARAALRRYSAAYKQKILTEYESLDRAGKGALLRWEGLYTSLISAWREQRDQGALEVLGKPAGRPGADVPDRELARLRRENERLAAQLDRGVDGRSGRGGSGRGGSGRAGTAGGYPGGVRGGWPGTGHALPPSPGQALQARRRPRGRAPSPDHSRGR